MDRYEQPTFGELRDDDCPKRGACWNCGHSYDIRLGGKVYRLALCERDDGSMGDVTECDPELRECEGWVEE